MADCATIEDIIRADKLDFDLMGTTLRGATKNLKEWITSQIIMNSLENV